jgi:hypothetical protein
VPTGPRSDEHIAAYGLAKRHIRHLFRRGGLTAYASIQVQSTSGSAQKSLSLAFDAFGGRSMEVRQCRRESREFADTEHSDDVVTIAIE